MRVGLQQGGDVAAVRRLADVVAGAFTGGAIELEHQSARSLGDVGHALRVAAKPLATRHGQAGRAQHVLAIAAVSFEPVAQGAAAHDAKALGTQRVLQGALCG